MMKSFFAAAAITAVSADTALAHSGNHSLSLGETIAHMLGNADHSVLIVGAIAAGGVFAFALRAVLRAR